MKNALAFERPGGTDDPFGRTIAQICQLPKGLHIAQLPVLPARRVEFAVCAALNDAAMLHHADLVAVLYGAQAVCDNDAGAPFKHLEERLLHQAFALGVQGAGGLVQDQDRWVLEHGASDAQALFLATTKAVATIADVGLVAAFEPGDKVVRIRDPRRAFDVGL